MRLFRAADITLTERTPILRSNEKRIKKINQAGITITFNQKFVKVFLRDQRLFQVEKVF